MADDEDAGPYKRAKQDGQRKKNELSLHDDMRNKAVEIHHKLR